MSDFNIKMTVRSARVLDAILEQYESQSEMARATGLTVAAIGNFVTMRSKPFNEQGWTRSAEDFATALGVYPDELWPEHMRDVKMNKATAEMTLDMDAVQQIMATDNPDLRLILGEAAKGINNPRDMKAVTMFLEGAILEEMGEEFGVTRERVRQILFRGLSGMKGEFQRMGIRNVTDALEAAE